MFSTAAGMDEEDNPDIIFSAIEDGVETDSFVLISISSKEGWLVREIDPLREGFEVTAATAAEAISSLACAS